MTMRHHDHDHDRGDYPGHHHTHEHHGHAHRGGVVGAIRHLVAPHSHDHAELIDSATATREGLRTLGISLGGLGVTAVLQVAVLAISGSVALLADTIHNVSDALTAVPIAVAQVDLTGAHDILEDARHRLFHTIPRLADALLHASPGSETGDPHATTRHHLASS